MNVYIFDIDSTVANNRHRQHLLREYCVRCGGAASTTHSNGVLHRLIKLCVSCDSDQFVVPQKSWDEFMDPQMMKLDKPIKKAQAFIQRLQTTKQAVHYITGRQERCRGETSDWLKAHYGFDEDKNTLLMRPASRAKQLPASAHKERSFQQLREIQNLATKGLLFHFFDDDLHVLNMYQRYGVTYQAPQCWEVIDPAEPIGTEKLFSQ